MAADGLMVEVRAAQCELAMEASYLHGDEIVDVRLEPAGRTVVSYVRTESIHIDIDEAGYPVHIEILGPPASAWHRQASLRAPAAEVARVRFVARERETGPERAFQTDESASMLRIIATARPSVRYVAMARDLIVGIDEDSQLTELWIARFGERVAGHGVDLK
jgi:hypothetical protein